MRFEKMIFKSGNEIVEISFKDIADFLYQKEKQLILEKNNRIKWLCQETDSYPLYGVVDGRIMFEISLNQENDYYYSMFVGKDGSINQIGGMPSTSLNDAKQMCEYFIK